MLYIYLIISDKHVEAISFSLIFVTRTTVYEYFTETMGGGGVAWKGG
jgi:hypothetical protein